LSFVGSFTTHKHEHTIWIGASSAGGDFTWFACHLTPADGSLGGGPGYSAPGWSMYIVAGLYNAGWKSQAAETIDIPSIIRSLIDVSISDTLVHLSILIIQ